MVEGSPLLIAHITDTHLFADPNAQLRGVPTTKSFQAILERLQQLERQPNLLLLTGDLSQDETPESYKQLQNLLRPLRISTYWIPGNHDDLPLMQRILNQPPIFLSKSLQLGSWHFILLCSNVPGKIYGEISPTSLTWLEKQLQLAGDRPTLVALHHPPFEVGSEWIDRSNLQNSEDLFAIFDRHPQIRLVLCGHIHQKTDYKRKKVRFFTTPSTCIQFQPGSSTFALDTEQPGFRLLNLYPDGSWDTKVERVPYPVQPNFT